MGSWLGDRAEEEDGEERSWRSGVRRAEMRRGVEWARARKGNGGRRDEGEATRRCARPLISDDARDASATRAGWGRWIGCEHPRARSDRARRERRGRVQQARDRWSAVRARQVSSSDGLGKGCGWMDGERRWRRGDDDVDEKRESGSPSDEVEGVEVAFGRKGRREGGGAEGRRDAGRKKQGSAKCHLPCFRRP